MMRQNIKRAYSKVIMSEADKRAVLRKIKAQKKRRHRRYWVGAATIVVAAAIVAAVMLPSALQGKSETAEIAAHLPTEIAVQTPSETVMQTPQDTSVPSRVFGIITLSFNPSVEFRIDEEGFVIEVVGTNEDGIALVEGMDASGLSLENATILVVNRLIKEGYINDSRIVREINLSIKSGEYEIDILDAMSDVIKTVANAFEIDVDVLKAEGENSVSIVLAANNSAPDEASPQPSQNDGALADVMPPEQTWTILFDYENGEPGNIWLSGDGSERHDFVRFIEEDTKGVVLQGISYLLDTGFISVGTTLYEVRLSDPTEQRLKELYDVARMMIDESGLVLEVTEQPYGVSIYLADMAKAPRVAQYTMNEVLNPMFLKDVSLITQQQMDILNYVYGAQGAEYLINKPKLYRVMPNLFGLDEQRAVEVIKEVGMVPKVEYMYYPAYNGKEGTVFEQYLEAGGMYEVGRTCGIVVQMQRPQGHRIVDSYVPVDMSIEEYEAYLFENDLVQAHMDLENIGMPPAMREEEYGPISQADYDYYNAAYEKIGVELRYLRPSEKQEYFSNYYQSG